LKLNPWDVIDRQLVLILRAKGAGNTYAHNPGAFLQAGVPELAVWARAESYFAKGAVVIEDARVGVGRCERIRGTWRWNFEYKHHSPG
jgi:hypothetical protein